MSDETNYIAEALAQQLEEREYDSEGNWLFPMLPHEVSVEILEHLCTEAELSELRQRLSGHENAAQAAESRIQFNEERCEELLGRVKTNNDEIQITEQKFAQQEFDRAAQAAPANDVLFYNMGLIYRRNGLLEAALQAFRRSQAINPRHLASHGEPRAEDRIREVEQQQALEASGT